MINKFSKRIMLIPHPDDELVFLSKLLYDVDEIISLTKPNDDARVDSFMNWEDGEPVQCPQKRSFIGLKDYVAGGVIETIPDFDIKTNKFLSNFKGTIIIPGFNYQYGHPHHIQLEEYMRKNFIFMETFKIELSKLECHLKVENFKDCYPTWIHMLDDIISPKLPGGKTDSSHTWLDFFMSGIEEALIFEKEQYGSSI